MGMTAFYGDFDRAAQEGKSLATIARALELGLNFFDTAWVYQSFGKGGGGNFTNEELLGKAIAIHGRDKFVIATKFGITFSPSGERTISGSEETIRSQLADSLSRLGTDYIDLYYQHRMDPNTPIEETVRVLKSLVEAGTIRYIGLSECTSDELRRAHAVHPITAIQMEWSLFNRQIEADIVPVARELGVAIVAYSPLGRGLLTAAITSLDQLDPGDRRRSLPRWQAENFEKNAAQEGLKAIADRLGVTSAQLSLAWLHHQGRDVFPIPGTKSVERLEENIGGALLSLTPEVLAEIEAAVAPAQGERY